MSRGEALASMTNALTQKHQPYKFPGFSTPNYTQVPDVVFDQLLQILSGAELKVLLYIIRRTFGFKKASDDISLNQMLNGIVRKGGERLDSGCGIKNRTTLSQALQSLESMGIILKKRNASPQKKDLPTTYSLRLAPIANPDPPEESNQKRGTEIVPLPVRKSYPQETVKQETEEQQHVVAALSNAGISGRTASKLVEQYDSEYLMQKVDYLEFLQEGEDTKVKRPAGWLRRAIEQDFAAPDGYKPPEAVQKEKRQIELAQKQLEQRQKTIQQTFRQVEKQQAEKERQRALMAGQKLEELRAKYQPSKAEAQAWKGVKEQLEKAYPGSLQVKAATENSHLLSVRDGVATFACMNKFAAQWIGSKLEILVRSQLKEYGLQAQRIKCIVINDPGAAF
jgi:hypothetical protein